MKAYSYVRFSTPEQEKGDSLRRQIEQSETYAQTHSLTLDDSLRLTDRGLSAFHGIHRTKGALGEFHRLVEQGAIEPGSVLLVESLDRLSRQEVFEALSQFTSLIGAGIKVVTLADRMEYDRDSINANFGQLLMSLVIMSRAHEESATKAARLRAAWTHKRREAGNGHKLTKTGPGWLKLSKDRKRFEIVSEAADAVRLIFKMKLDGIGVDTIVRVLNENPEGWRPPSGVWARSYLEKILRNRGVIGEFQPCRRVAGKHVPEGEPIAGYYPAIVPKEVFDRVQAGLQENQKLNGHGGGKVGPVNNLFSYLAKCAYCGSSMAIVLKGPPPKGYKYLVCDHARRGSGCQKHFLRYDHFENLILRYCKGLDSSQILPGRDKVESELTVLRNGLQAVEGSLTQVQGMINNLVDNLELGQDIKDRLQERMAEKASLETQKEILTRQITQTESLSKDTEKQIKGVKELINHMAEITESERVSLRLSLRGHLRRLIQRINVYPDKPQVGLLFATGERRLLTVLKSGVRLLDIAPKAFKVPSQLWPKPWKVI